MDGQTSSLLFLLPFPIDEEGPAAHHIPPHRSTLTPARPNTPRRGGKRRSSRLDHLEGEKTSTRSTKTPHNLGSHGVKKKMEKAADMIMRRKKKGL